MRFLDPAIISFKINLNFKCIDFIPLQLLLIVLAIRHEIETITLKYNFYCHLLNFNSDIIHRFSEG